MENRKMRKAKGTVALALIAAIGLVALGAGCKVSTSTSTSFSCPKPDSGKELCCENEKEGVCYYCLSGKCPAECKPTCNL